MPRPISWLPRLQEIRRSVDGSVRSHYTRADIQRLFQLQQRAAGKLLALLQTTDVAGSHLVAKDELIVFLEGVRMADDVPAFLEELREAASRPSQKKLRHLVRTDVAPVSLEGMPSAITLSRGELRVRFESLESLAESMLQIARLLEHQGDEFAHLYEPIKEVDEIQQAKEEMRGLFESLRKQEAERQRRPAA